MEAPLAANGDSSSSHKGRSTSRKISWKRKVSLIKMGTVICKQVAIILLSYCVATLKAHVYTPAHKGPIVTCPAISGYANISHGALFGCFGFGLCDYWQARYSDDHIIILCYLCMIIQLITDTHGTMIINILFTYVCSIQLRYKKLE